MLHELDDRTSVGWIPLADWAESARPAGYAARLRARNLVTATGGQRDAHLHRGHLARAAGWFEHGGGRMRIDELPASPAFATLALTGVRPRPGARV